MSQHEKHISACFKLAETSVSKGNHPFGALLVIDGAARLSAENTVLTENDVTRHAELNLVSKAAKLLTAKELSRATLYTSTEPCVMCAGAIYWANIRSVVFGCSSEKLGEIAGAEFVVPCKSLFEYGQQHTLVTGPILEEQGAAMHRKFWPGL